jgi:hypothetical protein
MRLESVKSLGSSDREFCDVKILAENTGLLHVSRYGFCNKSLVMTRNGVKSLMDKRKKPPRFCCAIRYVAEGSV